MNEPVNKGEKVAKVPVRHIDALIACADADAALLYLHVLRLGAFSLTAACRELSMREDAVLAAAEKLRRLGLLEDERPPESNELPQYAAADITLRARTDAAFEGVVLEAQKALGKTLNSNDLNILFGIYDHIGLSAEMILLLINHCIETTRARRGAGRVPTMKAIESEAWFWSKNEILTYEDAEAHIRREALREDETEKVRELLQIRGRGLTESEKRYISAWLDLGFSPEAIAVAYDRTILGTGKLAWKYMDKIISSWHEKSLHTVGEIEAGDARPLPRRREAGAPAVKNGSEEIENMRRLYERMKGAE